MATYNLPPIVNYSYPAFVDNIRIPIEYPINFNATPGISVGFQYKIINNRQKCDNLHKNALFKKIIQ